ncbi:MAG: beta-ketoacyl-ACP synthase II [Alphaproteobacteria bacterium]
MATGRTVVVTGLGLVTPLGLNAPATWAAMQAGVSGIATITHFDASNLTSRIAGEVKGFDATGIIPPKDLKKADRFIQLGWVATHEALTMAGLLDAATGKVAEALQPRIGAILGSGIGGLPEVERTYTLLKEQGPKRISPFFIPAILGNLLAGQVSIAYGLQGPNSCAVTACASGSHSIGEAMIAIQRGEADVMVAGGAEAAVCELSVAGFAAARALSTGYNETPTQACRPFDSGRDGFVIAEGAGVLILEEETHARARGATILATLAGFGRSADAYHMTTPSVGGDGAQRAMRAALAEAKLEGKNVTMVSAHATSTPTGDSIECAAIAAVCGTTVPVTATKSMTGHMLGAAGSVAAAAAVLGLRDEVIPPTINLTNRDPACTVNIVAGQAVRAPLTSALVNAFGFGGTNAALVFTK